MRCLQFWVLTMEVLTGKHPGDLLSSLSLSASTSALVLDDDQQILLKDVIDQRLSPPVKEVSKDIVSATKLAFACLNGDPQLRPSIAQAFTSQSLTLPNPFSNIKVGELLGHGVS